MAAGGSRKSCGEWEKREKLCTKIHGKCEKFTYNRQVGMRVPKRWENLE